MIWKSILAGAVLVAMLVVPFMPTDTEAGFKKWNVAGLAASIAPSVADTSTSVNVSGCDNGFILVTGDCDSATVAIEGQIGGDATWFSVMSTATGQLNGTDETYAVQLGPFSIWNETDDDAYRIPMPLPDIIRVIVNNNDTTGADTLETLNVRIWCQY